MSIQYPNSIQNISASQLVTVGSQQCIPGTYFDANFSAFANPVNPPIGISGNTTLSTSNSGNIYLLNALTANATITLPAPTAGVNFTFIGNNATAYTYTFTTPSGNIYFDRASSTSITVQGNQAIQYFVVSDGTNYYMAKSAITITPTNPPISITGNTTLTTSNSGNIYLLGNPSANSTITLPTPTTGVYFTFVGNNTSAYTYTFTTPSGNIYLNGVASTSVTISAQRTVQHFIVSDGTNYYMTKSYTPINAPIAINGNVTLTIGNSANVYLLNNLSANVTITLPTPTAGVNFVFLGNNTTAYTYTFSTPSGNIYFNGASLVTLTVYGDPYTEYFFISDGTNYYVFRNQTVLSNRIAIFLQNNTWTVPAGVTKIYVSGCGGGAGGGAGSTNTIGGYGGIAGQSVILQPISVTPGQSLTITIGAGGAGAASGGGSTGAAGGNTTITSGGTTLLSLNGGGGGGYIFGKPTADYDGAGGESSSFGIGGGLAWHCAGFNAYGYGAGGGGGSGYGQSYAGGNGAPGIIIIQW